MMINYAPIDADGHVMETDAELRRYLPPPFEGRRALTALFPSLDGWPRSTRKAPDQTPCLQKWRLFLDQSGVAGAVLYPTMGLAMAHIKDASWAAVMARCYNNYLYGEYLEKEPHRLWGVALLPIQDVGAAAEELERCVKELKMVGGVIPAAGLPRGLGHSMYDPLYEAAVRLNVPLAVHGGSSARSRPRPIRFLCKNSGDGTRGRPANPFHELFARWRASTISGPQNRFSRSRGRLGSVFDGTAGRKV
jgi:predicted TIM-barrel fold metal-dependent hydrolase